MKTEPKTGAKQQPRHANPIPRNPSHVALPAFPGSISTCAKPLFPVILSPSGFEYVIKINRGVYSMVKGDIEMLIGELAKRSGLTRDTIRFYEKEALIEPEKKGR